MKTIGYIDHALVGPTWVVKVQPVHDRYTALYVTESNTVENVNAEHFEHIGWILPADAAAQGGGLIYETKQHAGQNSVAAYVGVKRPAEPTLAERIARLEQRVGQHDAVIDPRLTDLEQAVAALARERHNVKELDRLPPADSMTFWDHAFIHAALKHPNYDIDPLPPNVIADAIDMADRLSIARDQHGRTTDLPEGRA